MISKIHQISQKIIERGNIESPQWKEFNIKGIILQSMHGTNRVEERKSNMIMKMAHKKLGRSMPVAYTGASELAA